MFVEINIRRIEDAQESVYTLHGERTVYNVIYRAKHVNAKSTSIHMVEDITETS